MSVILSTGSISKASKKRVTFFITFTNVFFIFRIKKRVFNVFYFFPNVYYNYGMKTIQQDLESFNLSMNEAINLAQNHPL